MKVKFVHITPECEKVISYCARVSNPDNQDNPNYEKLIKYLIENKHFSPFEMGTLCVEITTSRAIAQQILRHRSFYFQEFSQRYAKVIDIELYDARRQDLKNRQNSIDDLPKETKEWFINKQNQLNDSSCAAYEEALKQGIAKEQARFLLPLSTQTTLYMHGNIRNFIHYLNLRTGNGTQLEHKEIAEEIKKIFKEQLPLISKALSW